MAGLTEAHQISYAKSHTVIHNVSFFVLEWLKRGERREEGGGRREEGGGRREEGGGRREEGGGRREEGGGRREEGGGRRAERRSGEHTGSTIVVRDERLNIVISGEVLYCTQLCRNES